MNMEEKSPPFFMPFPRRRLIRGMLHYLSRAAFALLSEVTVSGLENLPKKGPLLVAGNHFSYVDPAALVRIAPWPMEFVGGARPPNAPRPAMIIPWLWGYLQVYRGTGTTAALKKAISVLKQDGVVAIFPEGGNWAEVLRPARPGTAFLAAETGALVLPVGLAGCSQVVPALKKGKRARVLINIGRPIGPFSVSGRGRERRAQLEVIGHQIMTAIAALLPPELRGHYSEDPRIREAARGTEIYPYARNVEGRVQGRIR